MSKENKLIKSLIAIILLLVVILTIRFLLIFGIIKLIFFDTSKEINGIENYNKSYYVSEYKGDLDSNLSIFPDNNFNMLNATFSSLLNKNLFDTDGYIILDANYDKEKFYTEIDRLKSISITIFENCYINSKNYTNYIRYDNNSYEYPAFITIDGFHNTYEYALIDESNFKITYIYLSYPNKNNVIYKKYLKKDKSGYLETNTLNLFSIYNHSFDNGNTFIEYDDCQ